MRPALIIDSHLHLDEKVDGTAFGAARELDRQLGEAGLTHALVLHLEMQPWSASEVSDAVKAFPRLKAFINVHPRAPDAREILAHGVQKLGYIGLKLHPRLQEFSLSTPETESLVRFAGELGVPVLIDAFPDGTHLMQGFSPIAYATLARKCPDTKIIWAHMGGHYVLDFMMLAKRLPNVSMDLSYSLLYYQTSSIPRDMVYAMRSMKFERIFYGSDYPDRSIAVSLDRSLEFLSKEGLTEHELKMIMGENARAFFNWGAL